MESPACNGRGVAAPFAINRRGAHGFQLAVAESLDREECDAYRVNISASNEDGTSFASIDVLVEDANDVEVTSARREDGGALDELPSRGGTVILFEGTGLGRVDPTEAPALAAHYGGIDGDAAFEATDCEVVRADAGRALRCTAVGGQGGPHAWTLTVDDYRVGVL